MTQFEVRGVELQSESISRIQAEYRFEHSCKLCCMRGLRIECDRCAIQAQHEIVKEVLCNTQIRLLQLHAMEIFHQSACLAK